MLTGINQLVEERWRVPEGHTGISEGFAELHTGLFFFEIYRFIFHPVKQKKSPHPGYSAVWNLRHILNNTLRDFCIVYTTRNGEEWVTNLIGNQRKKPGSRHYFLYFPGFPGTNGHGSG